MTRRRALAGFASLLTLPVLAACNQPVEAEDCDADDLLEGDEDCDLDGGKKKSKNKSKTKQKGSSGSSRSRR